MELKRKLSSRKLWAAIAAFLLSVSNSVAGLASSDVRLTMLGTICGVIAAGIYAFSEAYVDAAHAGVNDENDILEPAIGFEQASSEATEEDE